MALKQPSLQQLHDNELHFLAELEEHHQKMVEDNRRALGIYGSFRLPGEEEPKKPEGEEEEYTTLNEKLVRSLIKPVSLTAVLLLVGIAFKK